ncbi:MAG: adenosylcobinamide-phosphate synthase CbiB [Lentisphaeria bacterium]
MITACLILVAAVILDHWLGDPVYPLHPVRLMGRLIAAAENLARRLVPDKLWGGALLVAVVWAAVLAGYAAALAAAAWRTPWLPPLLNLFLAYSCIALGDLFAHANPIAAALRAGDLATARRRVQWIVGRDAALLDAAGVARATVESVAESFVDGFLAPVFWYVLGALLAPLAGLAPATGAGAAILLYRATNTMDSMVGYKNAKYLLFGRVAARADDVLNFIPARLALPLLWLAALLAGTDARNGWRIARRDRLKHASPNSAHTESFVAGALGLRLGGPTTYPHGTVEKPWLGDGRPEAAAADIPRAGALVALAGWLALLAAILALLLLPLAWTP